MLDQVKIKLTTEDESLKLVAEEIIKRCESEPALIGKVLNADKTLDDCWDYIKSEAKKKAIGGAAVISDSEVFGWAVHYFDEAQLADWKSLSQRNEEAKKRAEESKIKTEAIAVADDENDKEIDVSIPSMPKTKKPKGISDGQLSLF